MDLTHDILPPKKVIFHEDIETHEVYMQINSNLKKFDIESLNNVTDWDNCINLVVQDVEVIHELEQARAALDNTITIHDIDPTEEEEGNGENQAESQKYIMDLGVSTTDESDDEDNEEEDDDDDDQLLLGRELCNRYLNSNQRRQINLHGMQLSISKSILEKVYDSIQELQDENLTLKGGKRGKMIEWDQKKADAIDIERGCEVGQCLVETLKAFETIDMNNPRITAELNEKLDMAKKLFIEKLEQIQQNVIKDSPPKRERKKNLP
ncbi:unnamed protein product [Ambrosiozyma monospora]|uniref:Unnamed protein product n=1 Tax=Ambrosiozyma monospora TaxID=43982 RepID=A0A9W7DJS0_AMBMO|nr:unnamed protein product [Ambrosiozyma monospora]